MGNAKKDWADVMSESMDKDWDFSLREMIFRVFLRIRLVTAIVILTPLTAVALAYLVPANYKCTAKVLIKYDNTGSSFFSDIAMPRGQIVSGQGNAELLRSVTVCANVVRNLSLKPGDIKRPVLDVLFSRLGQGLDWLFKSAPDPSGDPKQFDYLAKELKESIKATTIQKGRTEVQVGDEIIEVTLESPNSELVAPITQEVCNQFIDEYFHLSETEAQKAYDYLTRQVLLASSLPDGERGALPASAWGESRGNATPLVESAAKQVASLELDVARLSNMYTQGSPELTKAKADLERARAVLSKYEKSETSRAVLSMLKDKQQQALVSLQLYQNRLIPVSVVEAPVPPRVSATGKAVRYVLAGAMGTVLGLSLGITLALFLAAVDRRLYSPWDCERASGIALAGSVSRIASLAGSDPAPSATPLPGVSRAIVNILGAIDVAGGGKVVCVTSPSRHEGKSFFTLEMAKALRQDAKQRVLLIDGALQTQGLSRRFTMQDAPGLIELLTSEVGIEEAIKPTSIPRLDLMPSGDLAKRLGLGYYRNTMSELLDVLRKRYDMILIDTDGVLNSPDSVLLASTAERVLTVVRSGVTRHETLNQTMKQLTRLGVKPFGLLLNDRCFPVPRFLYG